MVKKPTSWFMVILIDPTYHLENKCTYHEALIFFLEVNEFVKVINNIHQLITLGTWYYLVCQNISLFRITQS